MSKQLYNVVLCEEKSEKIRHKVGSIVVKNDKYLLYLNFELLKDFWMYGHLKSKNLKKFYTVLKLLRNYQKG